jgi:hypothetical protein
MIEELGLSPEEAEAIQEEVDSYPTSDERAEAASRVVRRLREENADLYTYTVEKVATEYGIPMDQIDTVAERLGLRRKDRCPGCGDFGLALPLNELGVPWEGLYPAVPDIGILNAPCSTLPLFDFLLQLLSRLPKSNKRAVERKWMDVLHNVEFYPKRVTDNDRIFLLTGLGRADLQFYAKAIVFPDILTPEERRRAQGYPPPEEQKRHIRDTLLTDMTLEEVVRRLAYQPFSITRHHCKLLHKDFWSPFEYREGLDSIHPVHVTRVQYQLLQTEKYIDVENSITWGSCGVLCRAREEAKRATLTEEEFLATQNCWFRQSMAARTNQAYSLIRIHSDEDIGRRLRDRLSSGPEKYARKYADYFWPRLEQFRLYLPEGRQTTVVWWHDRRNKVATEAIEAWTLKAMWMEDDTCLPSHDQKLETQRKL